MGKSLAEIKEICIAFLVDEFEVEPDDISDNNILKDAMELDSLDYVDLVVVIQREFGFKPVPEDFKAMVTFNDFYTYIQNKMN